MPPFDKFHSMLGHPDPKVEALEIEFTKKRDGRAWNRITAEVGAGWYQNRFLYLAGAEVARLNACMEAWSFLKPEGMHPCHVIGFNAYGTLLVVQTQRDSYSVAVHAIDPIRVTWFSGDDIDIYSLLGTWIPDGRIPGFMNTSIYDEWVAENGPLESGEILAIKKPLPLGGTWDLDNFQPEDIVSYYQSTGPIYAKALGK